MRVSRETFAAHRERIIEVAGALFRAKGYDGIGVADIMKAAGLTHGGFYGHFASKDDLAAAASRGALAKGVARWEKLVAQTPEQPLAALIEDYLSEKHRDNPGGGCLVAALGGEAARQDDAVRAAISAGVGELLDLLARISPGRTKAAQRRNAITTLAAMIGAMVLARSVGDEALSKEILAATLRGLETRRDGRDGDRRGPRALPVSANG